MRETAARYQADDFKAQLLKLTQDVTALKTREIQQQELRLMTSVLSYSNLTNILLH